MRHRSRFWAFLSGARKNNRPLDWPLSLAAAFYDTSSSSTSSGLYNIARCILRGGKNWRLWIKRILCGSSKGRGCRCLWLLICALTCRRLVQLLPLGSKLEIHSDICAPHLPFEDPHHAPFGSVLADNGANVKQVKRETLCWLAAIIKYNWARQIREFSSLFRSADLDSAPRVHG